MRMESGRVLRGVIALLVCGAIGVAHAKLPPPPPVDPAKAEEAKVKAAEAAKKEADALAKAQDRAVEHYKRTRGGGGIVVATKAAPSAKK